MKRKMILSIPAIVIAVLAVGWFAAPTVQAHDGVASGTCQGGVSWDFHNYDRNVVNTITVTIDGTIRYQDGDFKASDAGQIATDKTIAHTWDVLVNAPGTPYDRHPSGSYGACVEVAPTTTVAATTTIIAATTTTVPATTVPDTTVPDATTTSVVAVDIPPVPSTLALIPPVIIAADASVQPALPVTGGMATALIIVGIGCIIVGTFLVLRGRREG